MKLTIAFHVFTVAMLCAHFHSPSVARAEGADSVAIVSSVSGEATVRKAADVRAQAASFRGPVIYGDRVSTNKDATIGLLMGDKALLTVQELSEVQFREPFQGQKILDVATGRICLASGQTSEPVSVRTPTTTTTAKPGSLLSVEVTPTRGRAASPIDGRPFQTSMSRQVAQRASEVVTETFTVVEGSVDIVSQAPGVPAVTLVAGQSMSITAGRMGKPIIARAVTCRSNELQIIPQHTKTPDEARKKVIQQEAEQAQALMAAIEASATNTLSSQFAGQQAQVAGGTIISTTDLPPGSTNSPTSSNPNLVIVGASITSAFRFEAVSSGGSININRGLVLNNESLTYPAGAGPVVSINAGAVVTAGNLASLDPSTLTVNDGFLRISGGSHLNLTSDKNLIDITNSAIISPTNTPLIQVVGPASQLNIDRACAETAGCISRSSLFHLKNSTLNAPGGALSVTNGGSATFYRGIISDAETTIIMTTSAPLFRVDGAGSTLTVGQGDLFDVSAVTRVDPIAGVLEITNGGTADFVTNNGPIIVDVLGSAEIHTTRPLVTVDGEGSRLRSNDLVFMDQPGGGKILAAGVHPGEEGLLRVTNGARVEAASTTVPFIWVRDNNTVDLGRSPVIQIGVPPGLGVPVDTSLLEASYTLLDVGFIRTSMVTSGDFLQVNNGGTLDATRLRPPGDSLVVLQNASTMTVNGHFVNVNGGNVNITGNLLSLNGGSTVNINGGALINVANGGSFSVTGPLAVFNGPGNTLNITNTLCAGGCPVLAGVPVFFTNGGLRTNVTVGVAPGSTSPGSYTAFSGGTATLIGTPAVIVVDGPASTVRLGR